MYAINAENFLDQSRFRLISALNTAESVIVLRCEMVPGSNRTDRFGASVVPVPVWFFQTLEPHSNRTDRSGFFRFGTEEILYIKGFYT